MVYRRALRTRRHHWLHLACSSPRRRCILTLRLLGALGRHGNRPAHLHFFVTSDGYRKLTTQFNIEGDPLIWNDFAYAPREELIPPVTEKQGGTELGLKNDNYREIEFGFVVMPLVQGRDNQIVERVRAAVVA
ncbi:hypothetical protein G3N58_01315 [Paraburkholderia sp. Ac-20342]|nr:hypothetical protein [Paraburkholderia sp. Ac-20342]